ncbi:MAG: hypothetical protein JSW39_11650 [Desulfobacterales bacterium]|nr:MAG: hypothetical protein JSW39_11650 [Desulfobacterales bacterium]
MNTTQRTLLSIAILAVDFLVFFLPLTALFLVYIIHVNPPWFREFLDRLNHGSGPPES